jgi:hypothetical protein
MLPAETQAALDAAVTKDAAWFDVRFTGSMADFDGFLSRGWGQCSAPLLPKGDLATLRALVSEEPPSTVDSENRARDAKRVAEKLSLSAPEKGSADALVIVDGQVIARGFTRILYGDHGPYFELVHASVEWALFDDHILKGPKRHYHEHRCTLNSGTTVMLYDQFNGVGDEPNPPEGEWSVANNRPEGYAGYVPGRLYLSADTVTELRAP